MKRAPDKHRPTLFPWATFPHLLAAIEDGAQKYSPNDWQRNTPSHHLDKALRHLIEHINGEECSPDNGVPHVAAAAVNCLFALWLEENR